MAWLCRESLKIPWQESISEKIHQWRNDCKIMEHEDIGLCFLYTFGKSCNLESTRIFPDFSSKFFSDFLLNLKNFTFPWPCPDQWQSWRVGEWVGAANEQWFKQKCFLPTLECWLLQQADTCMFHSSFMLFYDSVQGLCTSTHKWINNFFELGLFRAAS